MTITDKAAEIKSALGDGGEEFGPEEVIEEALERRLRRHLLAELADEDEEPGERLMRWREAAEDLWDNLPGERLRHRRVLLVG